MKKLFKVLLLAMILSSVFALTSFAATGTGKCKHKHVHTTYKVKRDDTVYTINGKQYFLYEVGMKTKCDNPKCSVKKRILMTGGLNYLADANGVIYKGIGTKYDLRGSVTKGYAIKLKSGGKRKDTVKTKKGYIKLPANKSKVYKGKNKTFSGSYEFTLDDEQLPLEGFKTTDVRTKGFSYTANTKDRKEVWMANESIRAVPFNKVVNSFVE